MAKAVFICERCGRRPGVGNNKPHSQHRTKRIFGVNIQKVSINGKIRWYCTRCIQFLSNPKRIAA